MSSYGYRRPSGSSSSAYYGSSSRPTDLLDALAPSPRVAQSPRTYQLQILQEPVSALAAGLDPYAYARMPIIPAIVVRLRAFEGGRELGLREFLADITSFVCLASLMPASARLYSQTLDFVHTTTMRLQALMGQLVSDVKPLVERNGQEVAFFLFDNLSVRVPGEYCLRFRLTQALPAAPVLAEEYSANFTVYAYNDFNTRIDIANTDLSRHIRAQGIPLFLPPLT